MNNIGLHSRNKSESLGCEIAGSNCEEEFTRIMSKIIAEKLDINWVDRTVFEKLIYTQLKECLCSGRDALLEQYLHTQLDIIARTFNDEFDLKNMTDAEKNQMPQNRGETTTDAEGIGVNYGHATHAKLSSIIEAIKIKNNIHNIQ